MIGMEDLDGIKARRRQLRKQVIETELAWMCERADATGLCNLADDLSRRRTQSRHKGRAIGRKEPVERLRHVAHVAAFNQGTGNHGPADGLASALRLTHQGVS